KKHEAVKEVSPDTPSVSQPLKAKTTKAERRALQEAQRAAKAASKGYSYDSFPDLNFSAFGKTYRDDFNT
ncbi:translation initiation factor eIF-2B subunit delta-like, partial [Trifolium medium]|nr:translation initiation factor eIF-2B subunit delta-like [Trifolium medium]